MTKDTSALFNELIQLMAILRSEDGCPWDREQTHQSLKKYLIEETYEVIDAIDSNDPGELKEELGDLLLQVIFHAQIAYEKNSFGIKDILDLLINKLKKRHPHVFGDKELREKVTTAEHVVEMWEHAKAKDRPAGTGILSGVPRHLPSLIASYRLQEKAGKTGFDWKHVSDVIAKINEEIAELKEATKRDDAAEIKDELGDVLFAVVNLARHLSIDPEDALTKANRRFAERFARMEKMAGSKLKNMSLDEMDILWEKAKEEERANRG